MIGGSKQAFFIGIAAGAIVSESAAEETPAAVPGNYVSPVYGGFGWYYL